MVKRIFGKKNRALFVVSMLMMALYASTAMAYTDPQSGDLFFEAYDIVINKLMGGPIGFIIGAIMVIGGIISLVLGKGFLLPLIALVGGAVIVKINDIVASFGFSLDVVAEKSSEVGTFTQFLY